MRPLRLFFPFLLTTAALAQQPIRIWGDTDMGAALTAWEAAYAQQHPGTRFENHLLGTDTAMPALYGGIADIALIGREPTDTEHDGFLHSTQHEPLRIRLTRGALEAAGHSYAPVIFVARDNPLQRLTIAQLARVFGCDANHPPARTWGDLGLTAAWKDRPLHLYTFDMESGPGAFFLTQIQGPSRKMNWAIVREFRDIERPDGMLNAAGEQSMAALLADPNGIAVSGLRYADPRVKPLALAAANSDTFVQPTRETVIDGSYPLARTTYAFVDQTPAKPLDPAVRDFLRWLLSPDAQQILSKPAGFLPLPASTATTEAHKLE